MRLAPVLDPGQTDAPLQERFLYYHSAWRAFLTQPFIGMGTGGWPIFQGLGDIELHPHNLFLEVLSETGLIGFILLGILGGAFVYSFNQQCPVAFILILSFAFLNAMKSGDLNDNILLFVGVGLLSAHKKAAFKRRL